MRAFNIQKTTSRRLSWQAVTSLRQESMRCLPWRLNTLGCRPPPPPRLYQRGRCLDQITGARPVQLRQLISHYYRPF